MSESRDLSQACHMTIKVIPNTGTVPEAWKRQALSREEGSRGPYF